MSMSVNEVRVWRQADGSECVIAPLLIASLTRPYPYVDATALDHSTTIISNHFSQLRHSIACTIDAALYLLAACETLYKLFSSLIFPLCLRCALPGYETTSNSFRQYLEDNDCFVFMNCLPWLTLFSRRMRLVDEDNRRCHSSRISDML